MADFKQNYFQKRTKDRGPRSNNRISSPEVQVIGSDGQNLGILNTNEAISKAKNHQTRTRRIKTYNTAEVENWLDDVADKTSKFVHGGDFDVERNMFGYCSVNVQDPFFNAAKKYAEHGTKSYVVLHCKSPGKTQTIQDKRRTLLKQLAELKTTFRRIGIKTDFLTVLGFLPQDTETEKMNLLA